MVFAFLNVKKIILRMWERYFQDTIFTIHQGGLNMLNGS